MKLTQKALEIIRKPEVRRLLAIALDCTDQTIMRYIRTNDDCLTKAAALKLIQEETGLTNEEILETEEDLMGR